MKSMRGSFLGNLKLIPTITNLNQGLVLHLNPPDIFCIQECPTPPSIHGDDGHKGSKGDNDSQEEEETEQAEENLEAPNTSPKVACSNEFELGFPSLTEFEEISPPEGKHSIILYTTSMRGIRKTFQDCNRIRFLLRSFKVKYHERDVSLHLEYREELWKILGGKVIPPKLFVKGRYIGGADEVVGLHEMGWLGKLLEGTPTESTQRPCTGCANLRFSICSNCNGSRKVFASGGDDNDNNSSNVEFFIRCGDCNENGLVKCTMCC